MGFFWILLRKFAFLVKDLNIVLLVRQEQVIVEWFQEGHGTIHWAVFMLAL